MNRITTLKTLTIGAALAGMAVFGAGTAAADFPPPPAAVAGTTTDCTTGGAKSSRCTTNGSTALHTSPLTTVEPRMYGPYVSAEMVWLVAD